jgi:hypothetical protein
LYFKKNVNFYPEKWPKLAKIVIISLALEHCEKLLPPGKDGNQDWVGTLVFLSVVASVACDHNLVGKVQVTPGADLMKFRTKTVKK